MCVTRKGAASLVTPSKGGNSPAMVAVFGSSRREREVVRELVVRERSRYRDREREREMLVGEDAAGVLSGRQ